MEITQHKKMFIIDLYGVDCVIQSYAKDDFVNLSPIQREKVEIWNELHNIRIDFTKDEFVCDGKKTPAWQELVDQIDIRHLKLVLENWFYPGELVKIKDIKIGEYFRLTKIRNSPVWVRSEYDRTEKKYSAYKFDDINHSSLFKGSRMVYVGFDF